MKTIPLTRGYEAIVDDEDFERVAAYKWQSLVSKRHKGVYAIRSVRIKGTTRKVGVLMHRFILGITGGALDVDHKNHNGLDNRRANLRPATHAQNMMNVTSRARNGTRVSQWKGVTFVGKTRPWVAVIRAGGKPHHIGSFYFEAAAAAAYNASAIKNHGEFAVLNQLSFIT